MENVDINKLYDVVVVGGGPAGLTAALYLARARYRVLVIEKEKFGGQITITSEVVNYPGTGLVSGTELTDTMRKQAQMFGSEFLLAGVDKLETDGDIKTVHTDRGDIKCFGILIATGARPRSIGFEGEEEFKGRGVAYCATCDGEFFTGKKVFVIGGGFAAAEESVFLTKYASDVTILIREDDFTCAASVAENARKNEKITVITNVEVESVSGDSEIKKIRYRNNKTGEITEYGSDDGESFGVFVFAGYEPASDLLKGKAEIDKYGYVIVDRNQKTNIDGVYAAGDVCVKNLRQVVTAVGDGALAATELERYAAEMQRKTGLKPRQPVTRIDKDEPADKNEEDGGVLFSDEMKQQLIGVFSKMERPILLKMYLDDRPVSNELKRYMAEIAALSDKVETEIVSGGAESGAEPPCVKVCLADGTETGLAFHGAPGGHEFTSFVLGLYNAAGPGQALDDETKAVIASIDKKTDIKIMVSLSCTMCPELVVAAQRIASLNKNVSAEVYDINHFPDLKDKYRVMSVPCMAINDTKISFGKKNIKQILELIKGG